MAKKMLIDATHLEETRVVVVDGNKVDDFDFESVAKRQLSGNIYLAKVTRVEPSLQAAFVDYGGNRHGFLAFAEIHPDYYQIPVADREALIAEEAAEQVRSEAGEARRDAGGDEKPKEKPRRARRKKPAKAAQDEAQDEGQDGAQDEGERETAAASAAAAEPSEAPEQGETPATEATDETEPPRTRRSRRGRKADKHKSSGLEVIDFQEGDADGSAGKDVRGLEIADHSDEDEGGDQGGNTGGDKGTPPKSMAEKTGLDEAETVSEDVEGDTEPGKATDKSSGKGSRMGAGKGAGRARKRTRQPKQEAAEPENGETQQADTIESIEPDEPQEEAARARAQLRRRYRIQDVIKVRQIMLVQVVKEERGNKGAALTTYLSLPGRYCVLMPNTARGGGISRKITNAADRKRLRQVVDELDVPKGMGLIVRTAGAERTKAEVRRDCEFLLRQWEQIRELTLKSIAPTLIYEEGSLIKRSIRDLYSKEIDAILVEGEEGYREAKNYMKMLMPSHARHVQQYTDRIPLFIRYQVESYLNGMFNPVVQLRSGGYIVIGQTEALVAIDVNSGRSTRESSVEGTALKTNLEAAEEISRQLRLRDLAGLIVIDFIDMDEGRNNRAVEKRLKEKLKVDRARLQIGRISPFGLLEMSRQRLRPGMVEISTQACPHCHGQGVIRSDESLALSILREIEEEGVRERSAEVTVAAPLVIANYIMNAKRRHLGQIEERYGLVVSIIADPQLLSPEYRIEPSKTRSRQPAGPEQVVTAESAVAPSTVESPEAEARPAEETGKGESRSRRRRGKRGGRRRRSEESETESGTAQETQGAPAGDGTGAAEPAAEPAAARPAEAVADSADGAEEQPSEERRPRKRRGGRGRSRRGGDDAAERDETAARDMAEGAPAEGARADGAPAEVQAEAEPETRTQPAEPAEVTAEVQRPAEAPEAEPQPSGPTAERPPEPASEAAAETGEALSPQSGPAQARREGSEDSVSGAVSEPEPEPSEPEPKPEKRGSRRRGWWQWR